MVSTLEFGEALGALETFYETQLSFPLPIGYDPERRTTGTGLSYDVDLQPRQSLFKDAWPSRP